MKRLIMCLLAVGLLVFSTVSFARTDVNEQSQCISTDVFDVSYEAVAVEVKCEKPCVIYSFDMEGNKCLFDKTNECNESGRWLNEIYLAVSVTSIIERLEPDKHLNQLKNFKTNHNHNVAIYGSSGGLPYTHGWHIV